MPLTQDQHPALVSMDLGLLKLDDWEATHRIKADLRTRCIRVRPLSGHAVSDSMQRAMKRM